MQKDFIKTIRSNIKNKDIILCSLKDSFKYHENIYDTFFQTNAKEKNIIFTINKQYLDSGIFLYIPKHIKINSKIINQFHQYPPEISDSLIVLMEEDSEVEIEELLRNHHILQRKNISRFYLKDNATLRYTYNQDISQQGLLEESKIAILNKGAKLNVSNFSYGGQNNKYQFLSHIGKYSRSDINWVFHNTNSIYNLSAINDFQGMNGYGDINIYGVAGSKMNVTIDGIVKIRQQAIKTKASLVEKILMLDKNIFVDAKPILEIDTDDVIAKHSVSMTTLFEKDFFYAQSRGIEKQDAIQMIVDGFLKSIPRNH